MAQNQEVSPIFSELESAWASFYPNDKISFIVQAPGRVNLIGEHVDHQAYPVCPCAIAQTVCAAVAVRPLEEGLPLLELRHLDGTTYRARTYNKAEELRVEDRKLWTNYIAAAYFGVVEYNINGKNQETIGRMIDPASGLDSNQISESHREPASPLNYSIKMLFGGDVPPAAGLSSSAAVVVATTLAAAHVGGARPSNSVLADVCARAERYSGVASGGMDQAAILLSEAGSATLIHFRPLQATPTKLPSGGALLIANTCREAPKAKMASQMYNKRVFELKAGCLALLPQETAAQLTVQEVLDIQLRDVVRDYLKITEKELLRLLPEKLEDKVWSRDDMTRVMGKERCDVLLTKRCGRGVWDDNQEFFVYNRIKHVLSESLRVEEFAATTKSTSLTNEEKLKKLGQLMNESGQSLHKDFDCSCPEIEQVVDIARRHGAYGSRLTGAGWGGCTVSLVPEDKKDLIKEAIIKEYYEPYYAGKAGGHALDVLPPRENLNSCIFITTPSRGAFLVEF
eukprot:Protomagalhaensia_sp_Gyna_25__568@NODE_1268_length_1995_cov_237_179448_g1010_i0_p1_GENE_NODE_1268_length_1995_cov_237_179448_g1010_i0NODE_1268_length_1995_cov_237_179448_g1010_i0_p1_ORF_typecomplete_len512_score110_71GHMP_kinases_C/PF08544_13/7_2e22GalKase_gal_bdg/PF10509_9/2_2e16GHMP_kinases_N/PF00288_26/2_9e10GLYCAM1/PF05242_11/0_15_NODE_1268_length_1995_cov_237_179448_g1010_i03141849